ncbi:MAG TPA: DedA family protein [Candidatus Paceibacterota bacterium]|nr:DedA family protein [Candidatus Paceibacterota bacterium]
MITDVLTWLAALVIKVISVSGYLGITGLMTLESACIPIPSEVIMPFAGYLASTGKFSVFCIIILGAIGNLIGSIIAYVIGLYGGRRLVEKYGKYILINKEELDRADNFFHKYGNLSVFFSRLLPIIRTFISLPAGIAKMPFGKFSLYTFIGSLFWSAILTYIGVFLGNKWQIIEVYFRKIDWLIGILLMVGIIWFIYGKIEKKK